MYAGTTTAGIIFGGETSNWQTNVEKWNGSTWTETSNLNTARNKLQVEVTKL